MLILLDENLPHELRHLLGDHDVRTVAYQGWCGLVNGKLLRTAEAAGFEVFVTSDQSIQYQQNRTGARMAILVLSTNARTVTLESAEKITTAISLIAAGMIRRLDLNG